MEHENLLPKRQILILSAQNELFLAHTGITLRTSWSDYGFRNQRMSYYNPQLLNNLSQILLQALLELSELEIACKSILKCSQSEVQKQIVQYNVTTAHIFRGLTV